MTMGGIRSLSLQAILLCALLPSLIADSRSDAVERLLDPLRAPNAPGCAIGIIQDGRFLYKTTFGLADLVQSTPINTTTAFNVASISKQFTAASLYFLTETGQVRLSDSVRRFIPELPAYADEITLSDLLHHTSGLRDVTPLREVAGRLGEPLDIAGNLRILIAQSALNFAPGTDYEYTNSDYLLLSVIIERVTGKSLAAFAAEHIFRPLDMANSEFRGRIEKLQDRATGYGVRGSQFRRIPFPLLVAGDGGLFTSLEDLLRWDQNFSTGTLGGKALHEFMESRGQLRSGERIHYASGLLVDRYRGLPAVHHDGWLPGYRSDFMRFPSQHLSVVCLCNRSDAETGELAREIASIYLSGKVKSLPQQANLDYVTSKFPELGGSWESKQGWIVRMWSGVDGLWVELPQGRHKLFPLNRQQMFSDDGGSPLVLTERTADRIELGWEGAIPTIYDRLRTVLPRKEELPAYAGEYRSADADAQYRVTADQGRLLLTTVAGWRVPLDAVGSDRFLFGPWSLRFIRDSEGQVEGVQLHRARLWNLWFEKLR